MKMHTEVTLLYNAKYNANFLTRNKSTIAFVQLQIFQNYYFAFPFIFPFIILGFTSFIRIYTF